LSPMEKSAIDALTEEVRGYRAEVQILHTKLFGDKDGENPRGRLPQLESQVERQSRRIDRIAPLGLWLRALRAVAIAAAGYAIKSFLPFKGH